MAAVSWANLILFLTVGLTAAFIAFQGDDTPSAEFTHLVDQVPVLIFALVAGTLFIYAQGAARKARFKAVNTISHRLAREIKTPLKSITTIGLGLKQYLPVLLDAHALARSHGLSVQDLPNAHRDALKQAASRLQAELHQVSASFQMLMDNSEEVDFQSLPRASLSIRECVRLAIARFPFSSDAQRRLVKWRGGDDFSLIANEGITIRILMNLIKAALMGVTRIGRGEVNIRLEPSRNGNRLVVQLVGWSIPVRLIGHVFEEASFLETGSGTGSGLFFIKRAMSALGGQALCEAQSGAYTNFILEFPQVGKSTRA
jgi:two-component system CAI-1 autoinducer sensor kinase/phosphatase CqsS